jgi:hypothetical protein
MKNKIILLLVILCVTSCKEGNNILDINNNISLFPTVSTGDYEWGNFELLLNLDKSNLTGIIELESLHQNELIFDSVGNFVPYQGTSYGLKGKITNPSRNAFVSLSPASLVVNAFQMQEYATGRYYVPSHLDVENYFGSGYNKIVIDSNQYFDKLIDSVSFGNSISIINVIAGQSVDRNQNFTINYVGASSNSLIEYKLRIIDGEFNNLDVDSLHTIRGVWNMQTYNGQIVIPVSLLEVMKAGYYTLTITAYEPKYVTLSNSKEILMLGLSKYRTTIKIED